MNTEFNGHIVLIGKPDADSEQIAQLTVEWIMKNEVSKDPTIYICPDIETARASIEAPLFEGSAPSLVIINHIESDPELLNFSKFVRSCIPETWVVDLLQSTDQLPSDPSAYTLLKPVHEEDWSGFLSHLFTNAPNPQWSRAISNTNN